MTAQATPAAAATDVAPATKAATTEYFVFAVDLDTGVLAPASNGTIAAANDVAAIKAVTSDAGSFVAVPQRSLRYRTREIKTVTKDEWS